MGTTMKINPNMLAKPNPKCPVCYGRGKVRYIENGKRMEYDCACVSPKNMKCKSVDAREVES